MIKAELSDAECKYLQEITDREVTRLEPKINADCSEKDRNRYHCASGIFNLLTTEWAKKVEQES